MPKQSNNQEFDFEKSMTELEAIVSEMESDQLPLEDLIAYYEKGSKLLKGCEETLLQAKKRLQTIAKCAESATDSTHSSTPSAPSASDDDDIRLF